MKGLFITFEGPDGAGKTTQLRRLSAELEQRGYRITVTREPGGTAISDCIRSILLSPDSREMIDQTEVLLYAASRAQHVHELIIPALNDNRIVLCDRFIDASIAYQAFGLGIDEAAVRAVNRFASSGLSPKRSYLLDIPVEESRKRLMQRAGSGGEALDRIEQKGKDYHQRVREGFLRLAQEDPERIRLVYADRPADDIFTEILNDCLCLLVKVNFQEG